jgi:hypothetical protein
MSKIIFRSNKFLLSSVIFILLFASPLAQSASSGIGDDADDGCLCHGSKSQSTTVVIEGLPQQWAANQSYDMAITINSTIEKSQDSDARLGGFRLIINDGIVVFEENNNSQIIDNGYTHTAQGNEYRQWNFTWTAPTSNDTVVTFVAHGNAVNSDQQTTGDAWNYVSYSVAGEGFTGVIKEPPNYSNEIDNGEIALLIFSVITLVGLFYYSTK